MVDLRTFLRLQIRGTRTEDESKIIKIINPNEDMTLLRIKDAVDQVWLVKSEVYPERFPANAVLFGGMFRKVRINSKFNNPEKKHTKEIVFNGKRISIALVGAKRRCYMCNSAYHVKEACFRSEMVVEASTEDEREEVR